MGLWFAYGNFWDVVRNGILLGGYRRLNVANTIERHIKDKNLPGVILERHREAVAQRSLLYLVF